jgi:hypothetical protein
VEPPADAVPGKNRPRTPDRSGNPRSRAESSRTAGPGGGTPTPGEEGRRKRNPPRYVGWGDGLTREFCDRMSHRIPPAFPVAAHGGAATIRAVVVARRPDALLLCTFDHCGPHVWPDGDVVDEDAAG